MVLHDPVLMPDDRLYETDFHRWALDQAEALRRAAGHAGLGIDWENLAGEIESMGRRELKSLLQTLIRVIGHLLKLAYSPARDPRRGWEESVIVHRRHARADLEMSPSLRGKIHLETLYREARRDAARGLARDGIAAAELPEACPWTLEALLDSDHWPVNRHGLL
jgi:hypothetical protein